jgi:hypothetical protein
MPLRPPPTRPARACGCQYRREPALHAAVSPWAYTALALEALQPTAARFARPCPFSSPAVPSHLALLSPRENWLVSSPLLPRGGPGSFGTKMVKTVISKSTNFCVNTAPIIVNTSNTTPNRHLLAFAFIKQNVSAVQRCWAQAVNVGGGGGSTASSVFFRCAGHVGLLSP